MAWKDFFEWAFNGIGTWFIGMLLSFFLGYKVGMIDLSLCENRIKAEKMNAALNLPVQTFAANSVINLNCSMEKTHKMSFETALKNYSEMNKRLENLDKVGQLNPLFEFLFRNKCKNIK